MKKISLIFLCCLSTTLFADEFSVIENSLRVAMQADIRSLDEKARDPNRKPLETLKFFGLRENMKVVEFIPGGGWYTKLLAPILSEKGEFIVALGTAGIEQNLLKQAGFDKVKVAASKAKMGRPEGSRFYNLDIPKMDITGADMVLTFRNYHNFSEAGRRKMNEFAFKALKKGGVYGIVDHTRRHMEEDGPENRRRFDPVLCIKEVQEAGFELVDYTNLHYRADDELRYEVGRRSVTGNTDRFTLKFVKK